MDSGAGRSSRPPGETSTEAASDIATDLVEYLVLSIPGPAALSTIGPDLIRSVDASVIRILDLVVISVGGDGRPNVIEVDSMDDLDTLVDVIVCRGFLLSYHDIELIALSLQPGGCAVVVVAEDRWAAPLAAAARSLGGEVRAGERVARHRVEAALLRARQHRRGASS